MKKFLASTEAERHNSHDQKHHQTEFGDTGGTRRNATKAQDRGNERDDKKSTA